MISACTKALIYHYCETDLRDYLIVANLFYGLAKLGATYPCYTASVVIKTVMQYVVSEVDCQHKRMEMTCKQFVNYG